MRKKEKVITMTVTLILVVILICIKVTHFVKMCIRDRSYSEVSAPLPKQRNRA